MKIALKVGAIKSQDELNSILEPSTVTVFIFNITLTILTQNSRFAKLSSNQTTFCFLESNNNFLIVVFDVKVRDITDKVFPKFIVTVTVVVVVYVDVVQVLATSGCCPLTLNAKSLRCKSLISSSCLSLKQNKRSFQYFCAFDSSLDSSHATEFIK